MKVALNITGMHCPSCEILIKEGIEELPGIKKVEVSRPENKATVEFDEKKTNLDSIKRQIKKEGYDVK